MPVSYGHKRGGWGGEDRIRLLLMRQLCIVLHFANGMQFNDKSFVIAEPSRIEQQKSKN